MRIKIVFLSIISSVMFLSSNLYASEDFQKGFLIGYTEAVLQIYVSDRSNYVLLKQPFSITKDGKRLAQFTYGDAMQILEKQYANGTANEKELVNTYLILSKKYLSGDITEKEKFYLSQIPYLLIFKSNKPDLKYGYIMGQVYMAIIIMEGNFSSSIKSGAQNILNYSFHDLFFFSGYFFDESTRDRLYYAYAISQDKEEVINIIVEILIDKLNL